jgi:D-alanyl-D-alanine carboxypeptidase
MRKPRHRNRWFIVLAGSLLAACGAVTVHPDVAGPADASAKDGGLSDVANDAANDDASALDPLQLGPQLEAIRALHNLPSLTAAAFRGDQILEQAGVGVRKEGDPTAITNDDRWHLGSCTKAMTATLVAMVIDQGLLDWNDTLGTIFSADGIDPGYAAVTVEMILEHRGGFAHDVPDADFNAMAADAANGKPPAPSRMTAVLDTLKLPPSMPVGTYSYSNAGYMTLGVIIERKTGIPWETFIQSRLFTPLHMASCGFGAPATPPSSVDQPWAHTASPIDGGTPTPVQPGLASDNPPALGPAGTVHCSLVDWSKFLVMHARSTTTLVTAASMARLHTPPDGGTYAAGWDTTTRSWAGGTVFTHNGSNNMFFVVTWVAPADDLVIVSTTNVGGDGAAAGTDEALGPLVTAFGKK